VQKRKEFPCFVESERARIREAGGKRERERKRDTETAHKHEIKISCIRMCRIMCMCTHIYTRVCDACVDTGARKKEIVREGEGERYRECA